MTSFDARLRLLGDTGLPLGVEVDLTSDRMRVTSDGRFVANWALHEIVISSSSDGFHIEAEGEEVILDLSDQTRFAREVGLHARGWAGAKS